MKIVVVLEVMWGATRQKLAPRWYHINPRNHSGARLIRLLGHHDFIVTNACPEYVVVATDTGKPDAKWLRENLAALDPDLVLVCGKIAQGVFDPAMVRPDCTRVLMPHPAARGWTKRGLEIAQAALTEPKNITLTLNGEPHVEDPMGRVPRRRSKQHAG